MPTSSTRFGKMGFIAPNGLCVTVRTSVSHRIERGCSLSEVLEENPDPKYYLSEAQMRTIEKAATNPDLGYGLSALMHITDMDPTGSER